MKNETKNNSILAGVLLALVLAATSLGMGIANNTNSQLALGNVPQSAIDRVCAREATMNVCIRFLQETAYRGSANQLANHEDGRPHITPDRPSLEQIFNMICQRTGQLCPGHTPIDPTDPGSQVYRGSANQLAGIDDANGNAPLSPLDRVCMREESFPGCLRLLLLTSLNSDDLKAEVTLQALIGAIRGLHSDEIIEFSPNMPDFSFKANLTNDNSLIKQLIDIIEQN